MKYLIPILFLVSSSAFSSPSPTPSSGSPFPRHHRPHPELMSSSPVVSKSFDRSTNMLTICREDKTCRTIHIGGKKQPN